MLFLIMFSLAIAGITITELPIVVVLLQLPAFIVFLLAKVFFKTKQKFFIFAKNLFFISIWSWFLSLFSRQFYQRRYNQYPLEPQTEVSNFHLSTGIISEMIWSGKYLYINNSQNYLLYSSKLYIPGNQIRLVARNSVLPTNSPPLDQIWRETVFYSGFNWPKRSKMKWYSNILYETNSVFLQTGDIKWFSKIRYVLQTKLKQTYNNNRTAWLVLGMLIWDKSKFTKSEYQLFIDSGLVHLVAVSGGNIVMLVTFLTAILFFLPFYVRIALILLAVISYWIICWMDSSVLRAVLMWSLSLVALLVGRGTSLRRLLALVHIGMLVYNPYFLVYDVGYLLSFSAVLGIVFIGVFKRDQKVNNSKIPKKKSFINYSKFFQKFSNLIYRIWSNYLKPSLWATLGIFPVIIFFMGQINIGWIIGNIFVLPLVPFIMIWWFIGAFLPSRLQNYYIPIIDFLVERNYIVATKIDEYWPIIIADAPWIKFLLFFSWLVAMVVVISILTQHEADTTSCDKPTNDLDKLRASSYDDIINTLLVEAPKNS